MIACLLILTVAFTVVAASLIRLVGDYLFRQQEKDDRMAAQNIASALVDEYNGCDAGGLYRSALEFAVPGESRVLVLDKYGVVQLDTEDELTGTRYEGDEARDVLNGADTAGREYEISEGISGKSGSLSMSGVHAAALKKDGAVTGAIVYISSAREIFTGLKNIGLEFIAWMLVIAVLTIIVSMVLVRTITKPIGELNAGITRMAKGDLSARVKVRGRNEFSRLAMAFNSMSERIEQLDRARSQFVSNASHELKTPLSTIKILIETLLYQETPDPVMEKEFLGDINKEIDRLNGIVSDLLTLVKIDSGGMKIVPTDLRLGQLVQEQAQRLMPLARENGIELRVNVRDACDTVGDTTKLQQVFYNIIDNAIKYTPRGGKVSVELVRAGRRAIARISDTGIGIPEHDLPHIFERFYRVDKARSRETGGTGLGLSIVKQIVVLHGGDITADSAEGKGTTFTVELPITTRKE